MSYIGNVKVGSTTHLVGSTLYGTCDTAAGTAAKAVTCANFDQLLTGVTIKVKFTNSNTIANPTLNVNNTGAKNIYRYGTTAPSTSVQSSWYAGAVISFTYDGSAWMMDDWTYTADGSDTSQLLSYYSHNKAGGNGLKQYSLFARILSGADTLYSSLTTGNGTGTKTFDTTNYFDIRKIYYLNNSSNVASGSVIGNNQLAQQINLVDGRYTFNSITTSSGFTANSPIYMVFDKANPSYNCYKIKSPYWTHTPNDANSVYVLIGFAYDTYRISLLSENLAYEYKDSKLVPYGTGGGGGDADLYADGKIIIDTSIMPSGTSVKVTPTLTGSATTKSVTVGTPLTFDVPCYDRYKIEAILSGSTYATEYRTVDYGETIYINTFGKSTIGGIKAIVNAHAENTMLAIGDEVNTTLNGSPWVFQVGAIDLYNDHEVILVSKNLYKSCPRMDTIMTAENTLTELGVTIRDIINDFPEGEQTIISSINKAYRYVPSYDGKWYTYNFKTWIPNWYEISGQTSPMSYNYVSPTDGRTLKQFPIFVTQASRVRTYNNSGCTWVSGDETFWNNDTGRRLVALGSTGSSGAANGTANTNYILPCISIIADS